VKIDVRTVAVSVVVSVLAALVIRYLSARIPALKALTDCDCPRR
jgi:hypothetical protein